MNEIYEQALMFKKKYPSTIAWRIKQHCSILEKHINSGESVKYVFACQKNIFSYEFFTTYVIMITSERILIAQKRLIFGSFLISITPDLYNDLTIKEGLLWGKVLIDTVKEVIQLSNISKHALAEIETEISEFMLEAKQRYNRRSV